MVQAGGQNNYTNHISGGVYKNGSLSYISTGQGRTNMAAATAREEYYVKDHLGNIRSTVASAVNQVVNPGGPQGLAYTAGYEPADEATETALFDKVSELRADKPGSLSTTDQKAALLQDNQRLGTSIMLKVMAGDKVDINAENFYESLQSSNNNSEAAAGQLFEQVIGRLGGGSAALNNAEGSSGNALTERILSKPEAVTAYEDLLAAETDSTRPKAFLNFLFFDEEMNLVPEHSRIWQADGENSWSRIGSEEYAALEMPQNGYIVSYLSNQSAQEAWFDNLSVDVSQGILLEEQHYYAYGLPIAGLGSLAATATRSRQRYQGNEYIEERGLDWMDFHNRQYDPQLGRFLSVDPLAGVDGQQVFSPYHAMGCNPVSMVDPLGLKFFGPQDNVESAALANAGIHVFDDGTVAVFGGTNTFDYEGDYISQREHSEALFREHAGEYERASEAKSGDNKTNDNPDRTHDRPFGRGNYGSQTQHEEKNLRKRSAIVYFALYYLKAGGKDAKNYRKDSDYKDLKNAPKCNIFVYDMLFFAGINIGSDQVKARKWHLFKSLPPGTKEWGDPNYKIPGFITVSKPQAGDVVVVRGTDVGHVAIMVSETESVYTNGKIIMRSDFGSNPIWTTGDKNYWPGNNGYIYWRYIGE